MNGPLNASQIYEQINGGPGTNWLVAAQESSVSLTSNLSERAQQIANLASKIQAGWTGEAGNNAANAALPLAKASLEDASLLAKAGSALEDQTSAFGTVKNSVVPVPPNKPELTSADVFEAITTGNWNSYNDKVGDWQAKSQQNIDAFAGYHATSMGNGDTMPSSFTPLVDPGASVSLAEAGGEKNAPPGGGQPNGPTGGVGGGQPHPIGGGQPNTGQPNGSQPNAGQPNVPAQGTPPAPNPTDNTKAAAYNPPTTPKMPPTTPYLPPSGPTNPGVPTPVGAFNTNFGPGANGQPGGTGRVGGGTGRIGPGGQPGVGTGGQPGKPGAPGPVAGGPGRPAVPGNPAGPGRMVGGGMPVEGVAARGGAAGATGRPGAPGGAPMGGAAPGANRGEEDKEHQRPDYLLGPDPDVLFGGDREKPVPPVIGETRKPD
ncbi:PPE domain-containing protein [Amycolatopsis albispora]|uniref:PPE domain-containing protein n=1 Tax=Amycolatopsis albispora TaxID=1804986 RepID=A0A344LF79_9PSEU|nr:hypothetical protein [Amycolatopsis albispora]AXB46703.1 hypothetical protein A4R43_33210 [Amycolatopsis albispora]